MREEAPAVLGWERGIAEALPRVAGAHHSGGFIEPRRGLTEPFSVPVGSAA